MADIIILVPSEFLSEDRLNIMMHNYNAELNDKPLHNAIIYSFAECKRCKAWNEIYDTVK